MWLLDKHITLLDTALTAVEDRISMVNASGATVVRGAGFISLDRRSRNERSTSMVSPEQELHGLVFCLLSVGARTLGQGKSSESSWSTATRP
jgi:hypothetical protein